MQTVIVKNYELIIKIIFFPEIILYLRLNNWEKRRERKRKILKFSFESVLSSFIGREELEMIERENFRKNFHKTFFQKMEWLGGKLSHIFSKKFPPCHIFQNFLSLSTKNFGTCWRKFFTSLLSLSLPFHPLLQLKTREHTLKCIMITRLWPQML